MITTALVTIAAFSSGWALGYWWGIQDGTNKAVEAVQEAAKRKVEVNLNMHDVFDAAADKPDGHATSDRRDDDDELHRMWRGTPK